MNKVILMGRITKDIELKVSQSGTNLCDFTIAVERRFVKAGEERQTDFIYCRAFRKTAEFISKWFSKGRMICIVGSIQTRTWEDGEGNRQYRTEVIAEEGYFCGDKPAQNTNLNSEEFIPILDNAGLPW